VFVNCHVGTVDGSSRATRESCEQGPPQWVEACMHQLAVAAAACEANRTLAYASQSTGASAGSQRSPSARDLQEGEVSSLLQQ
jgi:hypothetical protein